MRTKTITYAAVGILIAAAGGGILADRSALAAETTVATLAKQTHFHGIAVDPGDPSRLYLATHRGLYVVSPDGRASEVSATRDDFMGFTAHPTDPATLYASGHPARGGNLGFIASSDGGKSWTSLSPGASGPVDFHQMDVSKADPKVIYGAYGDLQRSVDGGRTWLRVGPPPEGLISVAASSQSADRVYAATQQGLFMSKDGGKSWSPAHPARRPATVVHVTSGGFLYAFIAGVGLVRTAESDLSWSVVSNSFGNAYLLHLAIDPKGDQTLHAVAIDPDKRAQTIVVSRDGGATWATLGSQEG
ncbi:MAG: F510_1955 family glycosylhydrolase [Sphingomonadaceae bacterium]